MTRYVATPEVLVSHWLQTHELNVEPAGPLAEARVRIVGGTVSVEEGPPRLHVRVLHGGPVDVRHEAGVLRVSHPERAWAGWRRAIETAASGPEIRIGRRTFHGPCAPEAVVTLSVPAGTKVDVATASAPVSIDGTLSPRVKTASGDVRLERPADLADVKTVSGEVEIHAAAGDVRVKTVSGDLRAEAGTTKHLDAKTVSGRLTLDLDPSGGAYCELGTVSGDVELRLRSEPDMVVEAASVSGDVRSDVGLRWDDARTGRRRLRTRLGEGRARLHVRTVSGDLVLSRHAALP